MVHVLFEFCYNVSYFTSICDGIERCCLWLLIFLYSLFYIEAFSSTKLYVVFLKEVNLYAVVLTNLCWVFSSIRADIS